MLEVFPRVMAGVLTVINPKVMPVKFAQTAETEALTNAVRFVVFAMTADTMAPVVSLTAE